MRDPTAAARGLRRRSGASGVAALALLVACGPGGPGPGGAPEPAAACLLAPSGEAVTAAPLEVGLSRPVDPAAAPVPRNADEALLFGLLYEPLVRVDCRGRVLPALARSWTSDRAGRRWTFELREGARFGDGTPVTAAGVASSWRAADRTGRMPWEGAPPVAVTVEGERRISVRFSRSRPDAPELFARPALSVVRAEDGGDWPVTGTGPYRISDVAIGRPGAAASAAGSGAVAGGSTLTLERAGVGEAREGRSAIPARLRVRVAPDHDPRDLLDTGADLVVTDDPATLEYARLRPELSSRALPWSRTYVLAFPRERAGPAEEPPRTFLEALARDALREEARPAGGPEGGLGAGRCRDGPSPREAGPRSVAPVPAAASIAYPADDPVARGIVERIVALASAAGSGPDDEAAAVVRSLGVRATPRPPVAMPIRSGELPAELAPGASPDAGRTGRTRVPSAAGHRAYVVATARRASTGCPPTAGAFRLVPLIDTRQRIVHRSALPASLAVDGDGVPFLLAPGGR